MPAQVAEICRWAYMAYNYGLFAFHTLLPTDYQHYDAYANRIYSTSI